MQDGRASTDFQVMLHRPDFTQFYGSLKTSTVGAVKTLIARAVDAAAVAEIALLRFGYYLPQGNASMSPRNPCPHRRFVV